ncbi:hypothetical protein HD806DRAFT_551742 [Xylariaceae sp. AK1471]|nr:hypothetical protein HD806DRAFT_551550 [Xylariaceae sp. AK1471]KAI3326663.1 hypothetical protein HD806DRAFT_551742 [Xylariaceae sp. AK1471]
MFLSTFDDSLPLFVPLDEDQLGRYAEDHQWLVRFDQDELLVPVQPIFHSTFDDMLPSLLLSKSQPDESIENCPWFIHLDEPDMQTNESIGSWLGLPELDDIILDTESDITNSDIAHEEIVGFFDKLPDNQVSSQSVAQKKGLMAVSVTGHETPSNEGAREVSQHATAVGHSYLLAQFQPIATPYCDKETGKALPTTSGQKDKPHDPRNDSRSHDGHPEEGTGGVPNLTRKRKGSASQPKESPKRQKHHAIRSQVRRRERKNSARVRFECAIYRENSEQQKTFRYIRRQNNWVASEDSYKIYEADVSKMECLLENPGQYVELNYWKCY